MLPVLVGLGAVALAGLVLEGCSGEATRSDVSPDASPHDSVVITSRDVLLSNPHQDVNAPSQDSVYVPPPRDDHTLFYDSNGSGMPVRFFRNYPTSTAVGVYDLDGMRSFEPVMALPLGATWTVNRENENTLRGTLAWTAPCSQTLGLHHFLMRATDNTGRSSDYSIDANVSNFLPPPERNTITQSLALCSDTTQNLLFIIRGGGIVFDGNGVTLAPNHDEFDSIQIFLNGDVTVRNLSLIIGRDLLFGSRPMFHISARPESMGSTANLTLDHVNLRNGSLYAYNLTSFTYEDGVVIKSSQSNLPGIESLDSSRVHISRVNISVSGEDPVNRSISYVSLMTFFNADNLVVDSCTVTASNLFAGGISMYSCRNAELTDSTISSNYNNGLLLGALGTPPGRAPENVRVLRNTFMRNGACEINVGDNSSGISITGNHFIANPSERIICGNTSGVTRSGNTPSP